MLKLKSIILLSAVLFTFASCSKYEEGPAISLKTKKNRITNEWQLDEYYENGELSKLDDDEKSILDIQKDGKFEVRDDGWVDSGEWDFTSDKTKLILTYPDEAISLEILKLKSNELWLRERWDENEYDDYHLISND